MILWLWNCWLGLGLWQACMLIKNSSVRTGHALLLPIFLSGESLQFPCSRQQHVFSFRCLSCLICFAVRILTGPSEDICLLNTAGWSRSGLRKWADMNQIIISLICRVSVPSAAKDVTLLNYCPLHVLCLPASKFSLHSSSVQISHLSWLDEIFRLIRTTCAGPLFMCVFDNYTSVEAPK